MQTTSQNDLKFGKEISGSLCAVYVTIKRPSGNVRIEDAVIEAPNAAGELQAIKSKHIAGKSIRYDFNKLWDDLDENEREIRRLVSRTTAQNLQRGTYMMSMLTVGDFVLTLRQLREDRLELVDQLRAAWPEVLEEIADEFPDHYHLFIEKIPQPDRTRFEVRHEIYPLGTLSPDDLDLENLTPTERQQVIDDTKEVADTLFKARLQSVFDGVFGAILEICDDVEQRGFESGKRRQGAIIKIIDVLTRAKNFAQFANPDTIKAIESAQAVLDGLQIQKLNANVGGVQEKLRSVFAGVRHEVEQLREGYKAGSSRSTREAEF